MTAARKQVWWFRLNVWLCLLLLVGALCFLVYCFAPQDYFLWAIPVLSLYLSLSFVCPSRGSHPTHY